MKRIFVLLLVLLLLLPGCAMKAKEVPQPTRPQAQPGEAVYAVWITCYELNKMLREPGEKAFRSAFEQVVTQCVQDGINTIFVQVRPFCDAFYCSDLFAWSDYSRNKSGDAPSFDPLSLMVTLAHEHGLQLHAWVNPYRISYETGRSLPKTLSAYQICIAHTEKGTYFDPSSAAVRSLILNGMKEILENYPVDGIHIDDYFYPTKEADFDRNSYAEACALGSTLCLEDWRREQVNLLLRSAYALVKSFGAEKIFSVSPTADISKNRNELFADTALWLSQDGYVDWLIPQIYFGFENEKMPFEQVMQQWEALPKASSVRLLCGLAAYKQGKEDQFAGNGHNEWKEKNDVLSRQKALISSRISWDGFCLFSYSDCFSE